MDGSYKQFTFTPGVDLQAAVPFDAQAFVNQGALTYTASLPELAGKKVTLSYSPATATDKALLASFLPTGPNPQPADFPSSLPAYLLSVRPELRIEGTLVAEGGGSTLGTDQFLRLTFKWPGGTDIIDNTLPAGTYNAIVLDLSNTFSPQLDQKRKAISQTIKEKLNASDLSGVTKDELLGEFLHAAGLLYWNELKFFGNIQAHMANVATMRLPSEGIFRYDLQVGYLFGFPRVVRSGSLVTDVDSNAKVVEAKDGHFENAIRYMSVQGAVGSATEPAIYDQMLNPTPTGEGISAVHLLEFANRQGIPIYHINQTNVGTVLPQLELHPSSSALVKRDILSAVRAGKIVTISKTEVLKDGFRGIGYIILDPNTGAGGYIITSGLAGGGFGLGLSDLEDAFLIGAFLTALGVLVPELAILIGLAGVSLAANSFVSTVSNLSESKDEVVAGLAMLAGIDAGIAILGVFAGASLPFAVVSLSFSLLSIAGTLILSKYGPLIVRRARELQIP